MELKCPQCGKKMTVSQEELVIHDSQLVCPQCLAVCRYIDGVLVVRDDSDAPYRHTASVETSRQTSTKYCHSCGKQLPSGISFCPYCGADLSAPFDQPKPAAKRPDPAPAPVQEEPKKPAAKPVADEAKPSRQAPHANFEDKLRTIPRHYNEGVRPRLHQNGTLPSRTFKLIAYAVIAVLIVLLLCIIIAGINIEPSV